MTGVSELRPVIAAPPARLRVSVLGGQTQLDVALPADTPVAALLPELVTLIGSRPDRGSEDPAARDERRSFWVLTRANGERLSPEQTLRAAGIADNELLRLSEQRALSPPMLYDDVVDAAARLNRMMNPAWTAGAAEAMGFAGLWVCTAAWVFMLLDRPPAATHRPLLAGAALTALGLIVVAAVVRRVPGLGHIAAATAWPPIVLGAALGWTLGAPHGAYGRAAASALVLGLAATCQRIVGAVHWVYLGAEVILGFACVAFLGQGLGMPPPVLAVLAATIAAMAALTVPAATMRLSPRPVPLVGTRWGRKRRPGVASPGLTPRPIDANPDGPPGGDMPGAEQVWARVRAATLTRAGLLAGLATVVVAGAVTLHHIAIGWASLVFALACAAVLALRSRRARSLAERAALAVPATALTISVCVQSQGGIAALRLAGLTLLVALAVAATLAGVISNQGRVRQWCSAAAPYLDYAAAGALIPVGLWTMDIYDRLRW